VPSTGRSNAKNGNAYYSYNNNHAYSGTGIHSGNPGIRMAGGGAAAYNYGQGRVGRSAEGYRDRTLERQLYPNRRRKIITGKELTTPFRKKKIRTAVIKERIKIKHNTVAVAKEKFPVGVFFVVSVIAVFLTSLIFSQIIQYNRDVEISRLNKAITAEDMREKVLNRELEVKNDMNFIIDYAINELGMVKEDFVRKHYITKNLSDKVEIMEDKSAITNLSDNIAGIMSAIFGG